jgi:hypothetical protein
MSLGRLLGPSGSVRAAAECALLAVGELRRIWEQACNSAVYEFLKKAELRVSID